MKKPYFEDLRIYQFSETLSDSIWAIVSVWDGFTKDTVGKQLVRAVDSVGANIAEGSGHDSQKEKIRYTRYARASLFETLHWLRRAYRRELLAKDQVCELKELLMQLIPQVSAYINHLKKPSTSKQAEAPSPTRREDSEPFSLQELAIDYGMTLE